MANPHKAYKNLKFLNSSAARPIRILSEFVEPQNRFKRYKIKDAIVFFGSARIQAPDDAKISSDPGHDENDGGNISSMSHYYEEARTLAKRLTQWSKKNWPDRNEFPIMTGGGPGIMTAANEGASQVPDSVNIGLNISLPFEQTANQFITPDLNFEFHYFFSRKFWFINMARVLVVFPGGFGTLDELFELLTLVQTGKVKREVAIILFGKKFWDQLINFDFLVENGMISKSDLKLFCKTDSVEETYKYLTKFLTRIKAEESIRKKRK